MLRRTPFLIAVHILTSAPAFAFYDIEPGYHVLSGAFLTSKDETYFIINPASRNTISLKLTANEVGDMPNKTLIKACVLTTTKDKKHPSVDLIDARAISPIEQVDNYSGKIASVSLKDCKTGLNNVAPLKQNQITH